MLLAFQSKEFLDLQRLGLREQSVGRQLIAADSAELVASAINQRVATRTANLDRLSNMPRRGLHLVEPNGGTVTGSQSEGILACLGEPAAVQCSPDRAHIRLSRRDCGSLRI